MICPRFQFLLRSCSPTSFLLLHSRLNPRSHNRSHLLLRQPPAATETPTPVKPANTRLPPTPTPEPTLLPTLPPVISAGWEGLQIETVCLAVWDHYPQSVGAFTRSDEIAAATSSLLSLLGIQTVPLGEPCEAQLTVLLSFRAVGTQYSGDSVLYTGAQSEGQLTLSAPEYDQLVVPVNGLVIAACRSRIQRLAARKPRRCPL